VLNLYTNPYESARQTLWTILSDYVANQQRSWLLARDFNETRMLNEYRNCENDLVRRYNNFRMWIENNSLLKLGFSGPGFT